MKNSKTDWKRLKNLSESEIVANAKKDKDNPLLTDKELKQFKPVKPAQRIDVKELRMNLGLSQVKFAHYFGVSSRTIQEWEQHRKRPSGPARNLLKIIQKAPKIVRSVLED